MDDQEDFQKLLNYAYFFLKFRPRTKKELQEYLYKKIQNRHWSRDDVEKVIKYLEEQMLINDESFTKWFVEQRILLKPKSEFALRRELVQHGISKEIIELYFAEHSINEDELVSKTLSQRWERYSHYDKKDRFQKATSFLLRKGFAYDIVKKAIAKLENES